ncbi:SpoIIE family protein phosphatase [Alienimonas californiensis]|uniref:Phosphoserine phosphatase RsbU n=1 Tax=Alienimonas californiensis TaxID=2527989 RepID=A0A517P7V3_9PLAN|nr:SpoIIE family protein phosphatase [Alienimonas californiensis]QDT15450.1 Phosphoserine phosphatase RsbU [Alienimonas californiensis]
MPHLRIEPTGKEPAAVTGSAVRERNPRGGSKPDGDRSALVRYVALSGPDGYENLTIGRYPDCEVTLDIPTVSRRHARITRGNAAEGGGFYLEDLGSRNATLLRGEPVRGRVKLRDRDEIVICDVTLRFVATTPPPHTDDEPGSGDSVLDSQSGFETAQGADDPAMVTDDPPADASAETPPADDDSRLDGATLESGDDEPSDSFNSPTDRYDSEAERRQSERRSVAGRNGEAEDEADEDDATRKKLPSAFDEARGAASARSSGPKRLTSSETDSHYDYKFTDEAAGVLAALPATRVGGYRLDINPEAKLRAVLSITRDLVGSDGLDRVLDRTLASLFKAFPQADRGFVMLAEQPGDEPTVRATRTRPALGGGSLDDEDGGGEVRISRTIVKRVMGAGEAILSVDVGGDSRFDASSSLVDLQLRSVVCIPLHGRDETPFGVLQLDTADPTRQFSEDDLDLLRAVSVPIGLAAENARLTLEASRRREAERDLELAAHIQQGFLPQGAPPLDGYEFADRYESAQSVGGDYFDYIPLPDGRLAIALGDVAGKGVPAALLMARMSAAARAQLLGAAEKKSQDLLPSALRRLNRELTGGPMGHRFITCVMLLLDPKTHALWAVNAGHMAPLIRTASGAVEPLGEVSGGMPLGIDAEQRFEAACRTLRPGEGALIFTDGITEAVREGAGDRAPGGRDAGKELDARAKGLYGRERLAAVYGRTAGGAAAVIDAITADVAAWTGCGPQTDDICSVALRRSV